MRRHCTFVVLSLGLAGCAGFTSATIAPGHAGVLITADGAASVLHEGIADVPADAHVDDFDLTQQEDGGTFTATTADGVPVVVHDPTVSYALVADELVAADRELGPDRWRAIVAPIVQSTIAGVLATYRFDALTPDALRQAQARITTRAQLRLRPYHLALFAVELKGVTASMPELARAVTATSVWEQRSAAAKSQLEVARQQADSLRAQAAGIAAGYGKVAPTLSPGVLADQAARAWQTLVTSPLTSVVVAHQQPVVEVEP
ncbi:MAG TPA: SPFH domain-containing protein [Polyangia bacterium]|nr:SPFH domain-containing protein [Polyangia bacterium]